MYAAVATTAVMMSSASTVNPAVRSVPASASRVCVVVFVIEPERQAAMAEPIERVDGPVDRLPRHGQHAVDIEEQSIHVHAVESRIAPDAARGRSRHGDPRA